MQTAETPVIELPPNLQTYIDNDLPKMHGWLSPKKVSEIAKVVLAEKAKTVVEIGVYAGRNLISQALAMKYLAESGYNGKVIGIDPWSNKAAVDGWSDQNADFWSKVDLEQIMGGCKRTLRLLGLDPWVEIVRATSDDAFEQLKPRNLVIDVLIIDGNHSQEQSCRDVRNYVPLVRPGGHIFFDDVNWTQTQDAVDLMLKWCSSLGLLDGEMAHFLKPE